MSTLVVFSKSYICMEWTATTGFLKHWCVLCYTRVAVSPQHLVWGWHKGCYWYAGKWYIYKQSSHCPGHV